MDTEIAEFSSWFNATTPDIIVKIFNDVLYKCNFKVLNFVDHKFHPYGYTAVWLLSESHFAVHTFPEKGKCYIQLSSCNKEKHKKFIDMFNTLDW